MGRWFSFLNYFWFNLSYWSAYMLWNHGVLDGFQEIQEKALGRYALSLSLEYGVKKRPPKQRWPQMMQALARRISQIRHAPVSCHVCATTITHEQYSDSSMLAGLLLNVKKMQIIKFREIWVHEKWFCDGAHVGCSTLLRYLYLQSSRNYQFPWFDIFGFAHLWGCCDSHRSNDS